MHYPSTWEKCKQKIFTAMDFYSSLCLICEICKTRKIGIKMATQNVHIQSTFVTNFKPINHNTPNLWWLNKTILHSDTYMNNNRTQTQTWEVREFRTRGLWPDYSDYISIEAKSGKQTYCMLSQSHIFLIRHAWTGCVVDQLECLTCNPEAQSRSLTLTTGWICSC